jgi:ankyrin repeat protein/serine/threonine protein kinase
MGFSAVLLATAAGQIDTITMLRDAGADMMQTDTNGRSLLHVAAAHGQDIVCAFLIEYYRSAGPVDVTNMLSLRDHRGFTPVGAAVACKQTSITRLLKDAGSDMLVTNNKGWTLLHLAAQTGSDEMCELLITCFTVSRELKYMLDRKTTGEELTPVAVAVYFERIMVLRRLVSAGANLQTFGLSLWNPLHIAAKTGNYSICALLLIWYRRAGIAETMLLAETIDGLTPVHIAAIHGRLDALQILARACNKSEALLTGPAEPTLLSLAACRGHSDICKYLIYRCREARCLDTLLNTSSEDGDTPIMAAVKNEHAAVVEILVKAGADLLSTGLDGCTLLHCVAANGNCGICSLLLKEYVENGKAAEMLSTCTSDELTPAGVAILNGNITVLRMFIDAGTYIPQIFSSGWTYLHLVAQTSNEEMCQYLLSCYRNVGELENMLAIVTVDGHSAAAISILRNKNLVFKILLDAGTHAGSVGTGGRTLLHLAAGFGNKDACSVLISHFQANNILQTVINLKDSDGLSPVVVALKYGQLEVLKLLARSGAHMYPESSSGLSLLHLAAAKGLCDICSFLVEFDEQLLFSRFPAVSGYIPATLAAAAGNMSTLEYLIKAGSNVATAPKDGWTLLHVSASLGHVVATKFLIEYYQSGGNGDILQKRTVGGQNPPYVFALAAFAKAITGTPEMGSTEIQRLDHDADDESDSSVSILKASRFTPLELAVLNGHVEVLKCFSEAGDDFCSVNDQGWSLLHMAAFSGDHALCSFLLGFFVEANCMLQMIDRKTLGGDTSAGIAVHRNWMSVLELLCNAGANLCTYDKEGETLLHTAADNGNPDICSYLIKKFASCGSLTAMIDSKNNEGHTAASFAAMNGSADILSQLADAGADLNILDGELNSLLQLAAEEGQQPTVEWLIERGVDVHHINRDGCSAIHIALESGFVDIANLLLDAKCSINGADAELQTPLYLASAGGMSEIAKRLMEMGANLESKCFIGLTPLEVAASGGHTSIMRLLIKSGAEFHLDFYLDYRVCQGTSSSLSLLRGLIESSDVDDMALVQRIAERCSREPEDWVRVLAELGSDFSRLRENVCVPDLCWKLVNDTISRKEKYPIHCQLRFHAGSFSDEATSAVLQVITENAHKIADIDYFGSTALMVAISVGAPTTVIERLLDLSLSGKLQRAFGSVLEVRRPLNGDDSVHTYVFPTMFISEKVYIEVILLTSGEMQFGTCTKDWLSDEEDAENEDVEVGYRDGSCGFNLSSSTCCVNGTETEFSPLEMKAGAVLGMLIDASAGRVEYYCDGVWIAASEDIYSDSHSGGLHFIFSLHAEQACELNFGGAANRSLLYKPENYISVEEYLAMGGLPFIPALRALGQDESTLRPSDDCVVSQYYYDFARAITSNDGIVVGCICRLIDKNVALVKEIAYDLDHDDRKLIDIASPPCRLVLKKLLYFAGRYELNSMTPEYESETSVVYLGKCAKRGIDVAIKLVKCRNYFEKELESRCSLDITHVVPVLESFSCEGDSVLLKELERRQHPNNTFCIIMPAARRNLLQILEAENLCNKETDIKRIFCDLVHCVSHLHVNGLLHGDIKPRNIMRTNEGKVILIDMDSSSRIGREFIHKCSTAYIPPEALYYNPDLGQYRPRILDSTGNDASLERLMSHSSFDVWSLGMVLYQMCTGEQMFTYRLDDIGQYDRHNLFEWNERFRVTKLAKIKNLEARNLAARMLNKEPLSRPSISQILAHPYVSNAPAVRMIGEASTYDVFISYRRGADTDYCDKLYESLISKGLTVWMDRKSLEEGHPWEEGFCRGLVQSSVFVCLISASVVGDKCSGRGFHQLAEDSPCDNVLLEHLLALELKELTLLSNVHPIFIGRSLDNSSPPRSTGNA